MKFAVRISMFVSLSVALLAVGCSKADKDKAKEVGNEVEVQAKEMGKKIEVEAKKDEKLAERKIVIGTPVDFAEGMKALCESVGADAADVTPEKLMVQTSDALHQHPNAEVVTFWGAMGGVAPQDRATKLKAMVDKAGLTSCPLLTRI